jgi:hypothetical protein
MKPKTKGRLLFVAKIVGLFCLAFLGVSVILTLLSAIFDMSTTMLLFWFALVAGCAWYVSDVKIDEEGNET